MLRTQISLTAEQKRLLDEKSAETGLSLSELVRRAVTSCYSRRQDLDGDLEAIASATGAWAGRELDGERYVESLRSARRPCAG